MTVVIERRRVVRIEPGDTTSRSYGIAADLGSTTVVVFLVDLNTGEELAVASALNRQSMFGDDLVARLARAQFDAEGLEMLRIMPVTQLGELIEQAAGEAHIDPADINEIVAVGNMAMHHFLLGLDSTNLGLSPYAPVVRGRVTADAGVSDTGSSPIRPCMSCRTSQGSSDWTRSRLPWPERRGPPTRSGSPPTSARTARSCSGPVGAWSRARHPRTRVRGGTYSQGMRAAAGAVDYVEIIRRCGLGRWRRPPPADLGLGVDRYRGRPTRRRPVTRGGGCVDATKFLLRPRPPSSNGFERAPHRRTVRPGARWGLWCRTGD